MRTETMPAKARTPEGKEIEISVVRSIPLGLDMPAVLGMAGLYGLRKNQALVEKLTAFERECLRIWDGEQGCTEKKKAGCKKRHGKYLEWACRNCPDRPKDTDDSSEKK